MSSFNVNGAAADPDCALGSPADLGSAGWSVTIGADNAPTQFIQGRGTGNVVTLASYSLKTSNDADGSVTEERSMAFNTLTCPGRGQQVGTFSGSVPGLCFLEPVSFWYLSALS